MVLCTMDNRGLAQVAAVSCCGGTTKRKELQAEQNRVSLQRTLQYKLCLLGDTDVGKSWLVCRYALVN